MKTYESPLQEAAERFPQTLLWNDSCGVADLNLALRHGATGATSNPVIVGNVLRKEMADWKDRLNALIHVEMPDATDEEICWALSKEAALKGSNMLLPMFRESGRRQGLAGHAGKPPLLPQHGKDRGPRRRAVRAE